MVLMLFCWFCGALVSEGQSHATATVCECDKYLTKASEAESAGNYLVALTLLDSAMVQARADRDAGRGGDDQVAQVLVRIGALRQLLGDHYAAQSAFYDALAILERLHDQLGLAEVLNNIGSMQQYQRNFSKAREYYDRSLRIRQQLDQPREVAKAWNNFGALYEDQGRPDSALIFLRRSLAIWQQLQDTVWIGLSYLHIGNCLERLGQVDSAILYMRRSEALIRSGDNRYLLGLVNLSLGGAMRASKERKSALDWCYAALHEAEAIGALPLQQRACECLYLTYADLGDTRNEFTFFKRFIALRDSLFGQEKTKELMRVELGYGFKQQHLADSLLQVKERLRAEFAYQEGINREREQRNIFLFLGAAVVVIALGLWSRLRFMRLSRATIQMERDRSDALLLNILPKNIAEELKENGKARARDIPDVTILFTDFKGFTEMSEQLSAQDLVAEVDACFRAFDGIVERHGVEKIKTIGDAYMAAGGLPIPTPDSARNTVMACLEMQRFINDRYAERSGQGLPAFKMRVGVHTGPVVAGIVGKNKFAYDIWGDTVNTASRMESSGEVDRVNISGATYALVCDVPNLRFMPRGKVQAKGKGQMDMYYVSSKIITSVAAERSLAES